MKLLFQNKIPTTACAFMPNGSGALLIGNVEGGVGQIFTARMSDNFATRKVLGTRYTNPMAVAASADGATIYIGDADAKGLNYKIYAAPATNAALPNAKLLHSAAGGLGQTLVRGQELLFTDRLEGKLQSLNLVSGKLATRFSGMNGPTGLAMSADSDTLYMTQQSNGDAIISYSFSKAAGGGVLGSGIVNHPVWLSQPDGRPGDVLLFTEGDATSKVNRLSLKPAGQKPVATPVMLSQLAGAFQYRNILGVTNMMSWEFYEAA